MRNSINKESRSSSRRQFLARSGSTLASLSLTTALSTKAFAGERHMLPIALVGCGGRGTGAAANALRTAGPTRLAAMADVFETRLQSSHAALLREFPKQVDVPPDRGFVGLDAYRKAIDSVAPGGVVLLATPPAFRPIHLEYAVAQGCHVFMEKSFAVDAPGVRRVLKAGESAAAKNLKIAGGLMCRHDKPLEAAIEQIRSGAIGDLVTLWCYREHDPVGFRPRQSGMSELAHQIQNYSCFTWLNGSFFLDWLIHNLDVCCWAKNAWPISAQGQGGRQVRAQPDQMLDHYAVEFRFADGARLLAQARHMAGCWGFWGNVLHGTKGSALLGEGVPQPRIYKGYRQTPENLQWEYKPRLGSDSAYQVEHDLFFEAIRSDKPYNEAERSARAAMTGIIGRMAAESGKEITWDEAFSSQAVLAPGLEHYHIDSNPPAMPDAQGCYPIPSPGLAAPY